jgi:hypothetical protein
MFLNDPVPGTRRLVCTIGIIIFCALFGVGCTYEKDELLNPPDNNQNTCSGVPASFSADILPIIVTKCRIPSCHNAAASGGHFFQSFDDVYAAKDRIHLRVVIQKSMPPSGPLPQAEIDKLKCWIENGAPNN